MFAWTLNATKLVAVPLPCQEQFNSGSSRENTPFHTQQVHDMTKMCQREIMKAEIISLCWKAFHVIVFFSLFQRTLSLSGAHSFPENTSTVAVPQVTERHSCNAINTDKRCMKKNRIFFSLLPPVPLLKLASLCALYQLRYWLWTSEWRNDSLWYLTLF